MLWGRSRTDKTDFDHPGCGGMFYEKAHKMRFRMVSLNHDIISWMAASLSLILGLDLSVVMISEGQDHP